jgi:hypothetical protein
MKNLFIVVLILRLFSFSAQENCEAARLKYLQDNPDVKNAGMDPWNHYKTFGQKEGRRWSECHTNTKFIDDFLSKLGNSETPIINTFYSNESNFDYIQEYNDLTNIIEYKKRLQSNIAKLKLSIDEYKDHKVTEERYLEASKGQVYLVDEKLLKKLKNREIFFVNSRQKYEIDFTTSQPIIYSKSPTSYFLIYRFNSERKNWFNYSYEFIEENEWLPRYLKKYTTIAAEEKKKLIEKVTGLDDRFFELKREIDEANKENEELAKKFKPSDNGGVYCISIENNLTSGFGILFNSNGDTIFSGRWLNDLPDLKNGKLFQYKITKNETYIKRNLNVLMSYSPSGHIYCGGINSNGLRNGRGIYVWPEDDLYDGDWISGERTGKGSFIWANKNKYEGEFIDGTRTGKGTFLWSNGDKYEGDFISGDRTGFGKYIYSNGDIWEGTWEDGEFTGLGQKKYKNGTIQEGLFQDGTLVKTKQKIEEERIAQEKKQKSGYEYGYENEYGINSIKDFFAKGGTAQILNKGNELNSSKESKKKFKYINNTKSKCKWCKKTVYCVKREQWELDYWKNFDPVNEQLFDVFNKGLGLGQKYEPEIDLYNCPDFCSPKCEYESKKAGN